MMQGSLGRSAWCWVLLAAALVAVVSSGAFGQQRELRMDEHGDWVVAREPEPGSDEAVIAEIRRLIATRQPNGARKLARDFIQSRQFSESPWLPEAHLLKGDAWVLRGDEYKALFEYETVIREYPGSDAFVRALERELEIAILYMNGLRRKAFGVRIADATMLGEELLTLVQERLPGSRLAERAALALGDYYYRVRDMRAAAEMYDIFLVTYPASEHRQHAMRRQIFANIARFKGPRHDASGLLEARFLIEQYMRLYPADAEQSGLGDALLARLEESAAAQMYEVARWYLRTGDEVSARFMLTRLMRRHPRTVSAARAEQLLESRGLMNPAWLTAAARADLTPDARNGSSPASEENGRREGSER